MVQSVQVHHQLISKVFKRMSYCKPTATPILEKQKSCKSLCSVIGSPEQSLMSGKNYRGGWAGVGRGNGIENQRSSSG